MAKRTVPGLGKSKGMQNDIPVYPDGKYAFEILKWDEKESKNGTSTIHTFRMRCIDTFDDKGGNRDMIDKSYFHRMIEMHDDHPSYEQWGYIFVDELKSLIDAAGIVVKGDAVDLAALEGKTVVGTLRVKEEQDEEGKPRNANVIRKWEADTTA
jgi:hypothetical protein